MLIVCPSCATSYIIDPASVGANGRNVRCTRCKTSWFTSAPQPLAVTAFVDDVIAEAEARPAAPAATENPPPVLDVIANTPAAPKDEVAEFAAALDEAPAAPMAQDDPMPQAEPAPAAEALAAPAPPAEEPITIADAPSMTPPVEPEPLPPPPIAEIDNQDIESFTARRARRQALRQKNRRASRIPMLILALLGLNVALVGWRTEVVRAVPQTAALFAAVGLPVNLRGLAFEDIKITNEMHDGVNVLVIEGNIVSSTGKPVEVPRLRFAVRNAIGQEIYTWTAQPTRSILGAGETLAFRNRLASPPADAKDVLVRFFNRRDIVAGVK
jgi:predicted Zn finger-like uncharacterized protein